MITKNLITKTFNQAGSFVANSAAEAWCREQGISVGTMQRTSPRGLMWGDYDISKWRNLSGEEIISLHGKMTGDMREGPIQIEIIERPE